METPTARPGSAKARRITDTTGKIALRAAILLLALWCFGALYFDGPFPGKGNLIIAVAWLVATAVLTFRTRSALVRGLVCAACLAAVIVPWLFKRASHDRDWVAEHARIPGAAVEGDAVTFTDFRNFDYAADGTVTERWETRTFHLSNLRGIDFFLSGWGSEWVAHPIFSFDFGDEGRVVFSIEARREKDEIYTALGGLYKRFELIYLVGSESDLIRLRTNLREDENTRLFRLSIGPQKSRERFLEYVESIRSLEREPRFYNTIASNCTTALRAQIETADQGDFDWRLIANGKLDEMLRERNLLAAGNLPLAELRTRGEIDAKAQAAHEDPAFSSRIRDGVPGFTGQP